MRKTGGGRQARLMRVPEVAALVERYAVSLGLYGAAWEALHAALGPHGAVLFGARDTAGALAAVPAPVMALFIEAEALMLRSASALDGALTVPRAASCPHCGGAKRVRGRRRIFARGRRTDG